jgi:hypothetical protein
VILPVSERLVNPAEADPTAEADPKRDQLPHPQKAEALRLLSWLPE